MNDYSYPELLKMQEDAKKRVIEMKKKAKLCADRFQGEAGNEPQTAPVLPDVPKTVRMPVEYERAENAQTDMPRDAAGEKRPAQKKPGVLSAPGGLFGNLSQEETERMFILSLCLLLSGEKADDELLLSLMYMLT